MTKLHQKPLCTAQELETALLYTPIPDPENPGQYLDRHSLLRNIQTSTRKMAGEWDMTGASVSAEPSASRSYSCAVTIEDGDSHRLAPVAPLFFAGSAYMCAAATPAPIGSGSAKFVQHAPDGGDNWLGMLFSIVDASVLNLESLLAMQSAPSEGDFAFTFQYVGGTFSYAAVVDGVVTAGSVSGVTGLSAGDSLYLIMEKDSGEISVQKNNEEPVLVATYDFDLWPATRLFAGGIFSAEEAALAAGYLTFDYGTDDAGHTPFSMQAPATVPEGAADGDRYLVTAPGYFGSAITRVGDVVELYNSITDIVVTRLIPPQNEVSPSVVSAAAANAQFARYLSNWGLKVAYRTVIDFADAPEDVVSSVGLYMCSENWVAEGSQPGDLVFSASMGGGTDVEPYYPAPGVVLVSRLAGGVNLIMQTPVATTPGNEPKLTPALYESSLQGLLSAATEAAGSSPYRWLHVHNFLNPGDEPYLLFEDPEESVEVSAFTPYTKVVFNGVPHGGASIVLLDDRATNGTLSPKGRLDIVNRHSASISVPVSEGAIEVAFPIAHYDATNDVNYLRFIAKASGWEYDSGASVVGRVPISIMQGTWWEGRVAHANLPSGAQTLALVGLPGRVFVSGAFTSLNIDCTGMLESSNQVVPVSYEVVALGNDKPVTFDTTGLTLVGAVPTRIRTGMVMIVTKYGSNISVRVEGSAENPNGAVLYEDETTIIMLEGQRVAVIRETAALGNATVRLPPYPSLGDEARIIRDGVTASDTIVQNAAGLAVETVSAQADDTKLSYYYGFASGSSTPTWRRLPAEG